MSEPTSRFAPGGRARGARRSWRDAGRDAPPSHAVKRGTGIILPCTGCGQSVETIEIGTACADLDPATFRCALCLVDAETFTAPEPDPDIQVGPPEALRVLQRRLEAPAPEPIDLVALMGGPEGRPVEAAPPVELLVPRPPLPEAAEEENDSAHDALAHVADLFSRR
jgi:hypothetical protein